MISRGIGLVILASAMATTVAALDYWPQHHGQVYRFGAIIDGVEHKAELTMGQHGALIWRWWGDCHAGELYQVTASAVGLVDYISNCGIAGGLPEAALSPEPTGFWPPIDIVRPDLAPGDSWMWTGVYGSQPCFTFLSVQSDSVSVPYGTFDTLKVQLVPIMWGPAPHDAYWLHKELGPVKLGHLELVSIDGEVAAEPRTWSSIKSLYRTGASRRY